MTRCWNNERFTEFNKDGPTGRLKNMSASGFWLLPFLLFISAASTQGYAAEMVSGAVTRIIDGDSLVVHDGGTEIEARLWGIDSPEYDQPGASGSKKALEELVLGKSVAWQVKYRDRYGRAIIVLYSQRKNINETMVAAGNSWVYDYFCQERICQTWKQLQMQARRNGYGLWIQKNPTAPWLWKRKR